MWISTCCDIKKETDVPPRPKLVTTPQASRQQAVTFQKQTGPKTSSLTCGAKSRNQRGNPKDFDFQILELAALAFAWDIPADLHFHSSHRLTTSSVGEHRAVASKSLSHLVRDLFGDSVRPVVDTLLVFDAPRSVK